MEAGNLVNLVRKIIEIFMLIIFIQDNIFHVRQSFPYVIIQKRAARNNTIINNAHNVSLFFAHAYPYL
jgi:hypothetical protein